MKKIETKEFNAIEKSVECVKKKIFGDATLRQIDEVINKFSYSGKVDNINSNNEYVCYEALDYEEKYSTNDYQNINENTISKKRIRYFESQIKNDYDEEIEKLTYGKKIESKSYYYLKYSLAYALPFLFLAFLTTSLIFFPWSTRSDIDLYKVFNELLPIIFVALIASVVLDFIGLLRTIKDKLNIKNYKFFFISCGLFLIYLFVLLILFIPRFNDDPIYKNYVTNVSLYSLFGLAPLLVHTIIEICRKTHKKLLSKKTDKYNATIEAEINKIKEKYENDRPIIYESAVKRAINQCINQAPIFRRNIMKKEELIKLRNNVANKCLESQLEYDIVFKQTKLLSEFKYNLAALNSIVFFYKSGICNSITGHEGALNYYYTNFLADERTSALTKEIGKANATLTMISNSLNELCAINKQMLTYLSKMNTQLEEINSSLEAVESVLTDISSSVEYIAVESAVSAAANTLTAQSTSRMLLEYYLG